MAEYGEDIAARYAALKSATRQVDGPEETFALLVRRQSGLVFRVAFSVLRSVQDAEDVVQETFMKLYRAGSWSEARDERAFLARVARRLAVGRARRVERDEPLTEAADATANAEVALRGEQMESALQKLIAALPPELRLPLALSSVDEMSSREIAGVIGIPEGTVRTRLARARAILKDKLRATEVTPIEVESLQ